MKTLRFALLALLLAIGLAGAAHAQVSADIHIGPGGRAAVDLGYFYDDLASYGNWIERPSYGWVWTPRSVAASWQPYQSGHWVATDQGWTWVTAEPYGWATYHYGRWYDDPEIGWSWVPGNDWAPSWVSWQEGNNYIGWAPLPPSVTIASGFNGLVSVSLAPAVYLFVPERDFLAPSLGSYYVPRDRVDTIYRGTRNLTNYDYSGGRVYNRGVSVDRIQQVVGRPVTRYQLSDLRTRGAARVQGNQVQVFRPQVQRANVQAPSARPIAKKAVVDAAQFRQSHPERAGNRAVAQGAAPAAAQPKPARPVKVNPAQQPDRSGQNPPTQATRPRARNQASQPVEATPPARQRKANQPPPEQQTERPAAQPKHQRQPATQQQTPPPAARERQPRVQPQQDRQQRPPQATPPPKRQAQPQEKRQQQPPPPQNQQRQQRQEPPKDKPQQDDRKPPQR
jgi:hypothetical protein